MTIRTLGIALLMTLAPACAGDDGTDAPTARCDMETRADIYTPGMSKDGDDQVFKLILLESDPAPPDKGDNTWIIEVQDFTTGAPIDDATFAITPFMIDHGHGSPIVPTVSAEGAPGNYRITPLNLWMPGLWQVSFEISAGAAMDTMVFSFCVEG